jgi:O-antigen ligase
VLALLQFHGYIYIEALKVLETRKPDGTLERRLRGSGLFRDPNDVCLNLSCGLILTLYGLRDRRLGLARWLWLVPLVLFIYTIKLTGSRGGLLAVAGGLFALGLGRYGLRTGILIGGLVVGALLSLMASGRQASLTTSSGTGQERIRLAFQAMSMFRGSPIFGIGPGQFPKFSQHAAHNTYVEILCDLGLVGAIWFIGAYFHAAWTLFRMRRGVAVVLDPEMARIQPYVMATVAAYSAGMLSLTESYIIPTYAILGIAAVTIRLARTEPPLSRTQFDGAFLLRSGVVTVAFVVLALLYARNAVRWG